MKTIVVLAVSAFLSVTILSSYSPSYAAAPGAMSGKGDWATKGYNQTAKQKKAKGANTTAPKQQRP
jgi:hypothetical protein